MCRTCVDALNRVCTKILPVVNAATCAQVHVQTVFCSTCSMMVQQYGLVKFRCRVPSSAHRAGHDRRMLHDSMYTRAQAVRRIAIFFSGGRVSCALAGRCSPVASFLLPLQASTTKLTDVEVRFLRSTSSCWTRRRSLFVALRSAS